MIPAGTDTLVHNKQKFEAAEVHISWVGDDRRISCLEYKNSCIMLQETLYIVGYG